MKECGFCECAAFLVTQVDRVGITNSQVEKHIFSGISEARTPYTRTYAGWYPRHPGTRPGGSTRASPAPRNTAAQASYTSDLHFQIPHPSTQPVDHPGTSKASLLAYGLHRQRNLCGLPRNPLQTQRARRSCRRQ